MSTHDARIGRHDMDTTIEAAPVQAEPCAGFAASPDDSLICRCGWLEHDHGELALARAGRRRVERSPVLLERRAS